MPGHETVPPDPEEVRARDERARRPGEGVPGEDAAAGPVGKRGEGDAGGVGEGPSGKRGARDVHEEAKAAAPYTEPGDRLPAKRLSEAKREEES